MFSLFDFDVCTSPKEQEEAIRRARLREQFPAVPVSGSGASTTPTAVPQPKARDTLPG
jgi:hypothetical protein